MTKGTYVDGFIIPIPKKNTAKYKKIASEAKQIWTKFGALDYKECKIDQAKPAGVTMTFGRMAKTKPNEATWFSFIVFKSRAHRDAVNKKVMAFYAKKYGDEPTIMPFDMKRFAYAGFKVVVGK